MIHKSANIWLVQSSTDSAIEYEVQFWKSSSEYTCECKGYQYTNNCKHIKEVKDYIKDNPITCMSDNIITTDVYNTWCIKCIPIGNNYDQYGERSSDEMIWVSIDRYGRKEWHIWSSYYSNLIPRKVLSIQERKKLTKDIISMEEKTWIEPHRLDTSYIDKMSDSELFIYNKSMVDMRVKNVQ